MKGLVPTKMNTARRDDGDRGFGDWSRKRSPGDLAGGKALELRERDQPAEQVTERLTTPAPADPAQDAFTEWVYWCACWSLVFVHDGSSSSDYVRERRGFLHHILFSIARPGM